MSGDMRKIVKRGYEEGDYQASYKLDDNIEKYPFEKKKIDRLISMLPVGAKILDLGCGPGIPYDSYLVRRGFKVTGVDISRKHIDLARKNVPSAKFLCGDMSSVRFDAGSFDSVVSLYAIFHIPKEEHRGLLLNIYNILKDRGALLVTMGAETEDEDDVENFIGLKMAWSSYSLEENIKLIKDCGFEIIEWDEEGRKGDEEHHLWILARKSS